MTIRFISFLCGALFGIGGAIITFLLIEKSEVNWAIVSLCGFVMGGLAALFGKKFWETASGLWP
jgi:hypothetical protein